MKTALIEKMYLRVATGLCLLFLLVFVACSEDEKLGFVTSNVGTEFMATANGYPFLDLHADAPWSAETDQTWCRVEPSSGEAGDYQLALFFDENNTYSDRRATVTIFCAGQTEQIDVVQWQNEAMLMDESDRIVPSAGGDFTIEVEANVQLNAFPNGGEEGWLTLKDVSEPTKALTKRVYTFHAQPNEHTYSRSGYITFSSIDTHLYMKNVVIQVMQEQKDSIRLSEKTGIGSGLVYNVLGNTYEARLYTNVQPRVVYKPDWVSSVNIPQVNLPTSHVDPESRCDVDITVEPNKFDKERRDVIVFECEDARIEVEVVQESSFFPTEGEYVDMGDGTFWATHNIGAEKPQDYGGLYGWADPTGELTTDDVLDENGWWNSPLYGGIDYPGNICGTNLDIAFMKWGGEWRMPNAKELRTLVGSCYLKQTYCQGVLGYGLTASNGNQLFFPSAGERVGDTVQYKDRMAYIWAGSVSEHDGLVQFSILDPSSEPEDYARWAIPTTGKRYRGMSIRPVRNL